MQMQKTISLRNYSLLFLFLLSYLLKLLLLKKEKKYFQVKHVPSYPILITYQDGKFSNPFTLKKTIISERPCNYAFQPSNFVFGSILPLLLCKYFAIQSINKNCTKS